jgi:hypothetical protein
MIFSLNKLLFRCAWLQPVPLAEKGIILGNGRGCIKDEPWNGLKLYLDAEIVNELYIKGLIKIQSVLFIVVHCTHRGVFEMKMYFYHKISFGPSFVNHGGKYKP